MTNRPVAPIAPPEVLSPDRLLIDDRNDLTVDHQARAVLLDAALHESCSYAQQLWDNLDAVRQYLLDSLPPVPSSSTPSQTSASPTGPEDAGGWQAWSDAFAAATSVLCGPHGDSGFGLTRARDEAQLRRSAPALVTPAELDTPALRPAESPIAENRDEATRSTAGARWQDSTLRPVARGAMIAVVGLLALRGLRASAPPITGKGHRWPDGIRR